MSRRQIRNLAKLLYLRLTRHRVYWRQHRDGEWEVVVRYAWAEKAEYAESSGHKCTAPITCRTKHHQLTG